MAQGRQGSRAECVHLLLPGSNLPAKAIADNPTEVVIDWQAALAEPQSPG